VEAPILVRPDFKKPFCLDVDWLTKGVGAILSQREGRFEKVVVYASKGLTKVQRNFHPMEGECYALIWGIMHFRQYLHRTHFILRTDHELLEWLATVSDANGRRGRWIDMLQDFSFKILHRPRMRHGNADALSRNPVGQATDDDDFSEEVQDVGTMPEDPTEATESMFFVQYGQDSDWFGFRRHARKLTEHRWCCFGINHWRGSADHQLFMLGVVTEESQDEEGSSPVENVEGADNNGDQNLRPPNDKRILKERRTQYYDRQQ
jgi:hypothetical protein